MRQPTTLADIMFDRELDREYRKRGHRQPVRGFRLKMRGYGLNRVVGLQFWYR